MSNNPQENIEQEIIDGMQREIDRVKPRPIPKPAKGAKGQDIEYYLENGIEMRKYVQSGVIQRWNGDRWVFAPGTARTPITEENAVALADKRWDMVADSMIKGGMRATQTDSPAQFLEHLGHAYATHAIAGGRGGAAYGELYAKHAQLYPKQQDIKLSQGDQSIQGSPQAVAELMSLVQQEWIRRYERAEDAAGSVSSEDAGATLSDSEG